ncbi:MAG TPA: T9SS type A sorting domain-containing protein [Chitinophagales bacterium]|nr:T9SS type A sorting domain-containing protein [Chitinophagales bacterium]
MRPRLQLMQSVKVKVSVRARLIYASAGLTITAIIAGTVIFFYSNLGTSEKAHAAATGDYRSIASGNWNNIATWQIHGGGTWVPASVPPDNTYGSITIQSGNVVTITVSVRVDQVVINSGGEVDLDNDQTLTVKNNGLGTDLDVSGTFKNSGTILIDAIATVVFESGGKYQHARNGGDIPYATWNLGSTCEILGITNTKPDHLNQAFYNFIWNCAGETNEIDLNAQLATVNGDLSLTSTGTSSLYFDQQENNLTLNIAGNLNVQGGTTYACLNGSEVINVMGNYIQTGGNFNFNQAGATTYGITSALINVSGNLTISGGIIDMSQFDGIHTLKGTGRVYLAGNLTFSGFGLMTETSAISRGQVYFNGTSEQYFLSSSGSVTQKIDFIVDSGAILRLDDQIITGNGNFRVSPGGGLMIGSANGITSSGLSGNVQVTGTRSYKIGADYTYNGTAPQCTGNGLPAKVHNLTLNNSNGLTLTNTVAISNLFTLTSGIITTAGLEVRVTNNSTSAIIGHSSSNYVNGNLRRKIGTTGIYDFPVGTSSQYELATLTVNNLTAVKNILVNFNNPNTGTTPNPGTCIVNGSSILSLLDYGFWKIKPDTATAGGTFDLVLHERGYTNGGTIPSAYAIVTRQNATSDWISSGTHINNTQSEIGGTVTAVRTVVPIFGNFAIGSFDLTPYGDLKAANSVEDGTTQSNDFNAYPNPTFGLLNISVLQAVDNAMIRVFDIKGQLIKEIKAVKGEDVQVDLTGKSPGIYLVKVGSGGGDDVSKQIVLSK